MDSCPSPVLCPFDTTTPPPSEPFSNCECPFEASNPLYECPVCVRERREHHCQMCSRFAQKWILPSYGGRHHQWMESDTYVIICGGLACRPIQKLKLFCGEQWEASGSLLLGPLTEEVPARDLKSQKNRGHSLWLTMCFFLSTPQPTATKQHWQSTLNVCKPDTARLQLR